MDRRDFSDEEWDCTLYYRVEDKYIIYEDQISYLTSRLKEIMAYDAHSQSGGYLIRSVYFDDLHDSALFENEGGVDEREAVHEDRFSCS